MNLFHLQYFCDALEEGSLVESAKKNHVSPGAVSQAIKKLEELFGIELLEHQQRKFRPTKKGLELKFMATALLKDFKKIQERIKPQDDEFKGEVQFATQQSIANSFLPTLLKRFKEDYPQITPSFTLGHTSIVHRLLNEEKINFAITLDNTDLKSFECETLYEGEFIFVKGKGTDLKELGYLTTGKTEEVKKLEKYYKEKFGVPLSISMRIDSWGVIKNMASQGHGIGFIPDYIFSSEDKSLLSKIVLDVPKSTFKINAVWSKNIPLSKRTKLFLDYLKKYLKK